MESRLDAESNTKGILWKFLSSLKLWISQLVHDGLLMPAYHWVNVSVMAQVTMEWLASFDSIMNEELRLISDLDLGAQADV